MVRRRWLWAALVAYAALGVVLTLLPRNPFSFGGREWPLDVPVNLLMFAPPVAVLLLLRRSLHPAAPVAAASFVSASIEAVQWLSPREASLRDWLLNTAGAALAAAAVALSRRGSALDGVRRLET